MNRTFRITVDGHAYNVVVDELDHAADPVARPHETATPAVAAGTATAPVSPAAPAVAPVAALATAGAHTITAPIGGVVRSIKAIVGAVIAVGDKVAVIEVMKMKTEVVAKIAGKVLTIAAQVDEPVATGQVLMTLA